MSQTSEMNKTYEELVEELQYPAGTHSLSMWQQRPGTVPTYFETNNFCG